MLVGVNRMLAWIFNKNGHPMPQGILCATMIAP